MKLTRTALATSLTAGALMGSLLVATPASADSSKTCNPSSISAQAKGKVPVILVHGLMGNADAWKNQDNARSMVNAIKKIPGVYLDEVFDYSSTNTKWVTDSNNAPRLANRIDCLAQASGRKVAVVGHSMGGALARQAASMTVNGRKVANEFGMLITLGTPNLGSGWANVGTDFIRSLCPARTIMDTSLCDFSQISALKGLRENSDEIKKLPWMPTNVPVLALAGDVSIHVNIFNASVTHDTDSDLVVSKNSALQDIRTTSAGGGSKTFACTMEVGLHLPACWHSGLTSNRDVIQTTVDALTRFAKATKPSVLAKYTGITWGRHSSRILVNKDGTGSQVVGFGFGGTPGCGDGTYECEFNANLKFMPNSDGSLTATYTKVWYTWFPEGSKTGQIVPTPDNMQDMPQASDSMKLARDSHNRIEIIMLGRLDHTNKDWDIYGGQYYCGDNVPTKWAYPCGA